jgi:hypothetical protein
MQAWFDTVCVTRVAAPWSVLAATDGAPTTLDESLAKGDSGHAGQPRQAIRPRA